MGLLLVSCGGCALLRDEGGHHLIDILVLGSVLNAKCFV